MPSPVTEMIEAAALEEYPPSESTLREISHEAVMKIASRAGVGRRQIEIAALERGIVPRRYRRNIGTIGIDGQLRLRRARVAVVGAGGLGGTVVELCARLGIGALVIIDGDYFVEDNLNRQLLCTEALCGTGKADAAAQRVAVINSGVETVSHRIFLDNDNAFALLEGSDIVVDALDNLPMRVLLQQVAHEMAVPLVHGALAGFIGEVMTIYPEDGGLEKYFGDVDALPEKGIEQQIGTPTVTPVIVASYQVMEIIKIITGKGTPIRDSMRYIEIDTVQNTSVNMGERSG